MDNFTKDCIFFAGGILSFIILFIKLLLLGDGWSFVLLILYTICIIGFFVDLLIAIDSHVNKHKHKQKDVSSPENCSKDVPSPENCSKDVPSPENCSKDVPSPENSSEKILETYNYPVRLKSKKKLKIFPHRDTLNCPHYFPEKITTDD